MKIKITIMLICALLAANANAAILKFQLSDSLHGNEALPYYGLRLDGLYTGDASDVFTFSFVDVVMTVDTTLGTANIAGSMKGGNWDDAIPDGKARDTNYSLNFDYGASSLIVDPDGSWEFTGPQGGGSSYYNYGTLSNDDDGYVFGLAEFMGSGGWGPRGQGGPCRNSDGPWCGNGWLSHTTSPYESSSSYSYEHYSSNDFLYTGEPIPSTSLPEPGSLVLMVMGLAGIFASRRRGRLI